jgi:hypothetical protein
MKWTKERIENTDKLLQKLKDLDFPIEKSERFHELPYELQSKYGTYHLKKKRYKNNDRLKGITEIASEYGLYYKAGKNNLCCFHHDSQPSLHIKEDDSLFYCFGCGVGGDAINFVMEKEKCTFSVALRKAKL